MLVDTLQGFGPLDILCTVFSSLYIHVYICDTHLCNLKPQVQIRAYPTIVLFGHRMIRQDSFGGCLGSSHCRSISSVIILYVGCTQGKSFLVVLCLHTNCIYAACSLCAVFVGIPQPDPLIRVILALKEKQRKTTCHPLHFQHVVLLYMPAYCCGK